MATTLAAPATGNPRLRVLDRDVAMMVAATDTPAQPSSSRASPPASGTWTPTAQDGTCARSPVTCWAWLR